LPALTGLRFFAALYVLLFHSGAGISERLNAPIFITKFLLRGNLGVFLFFTLSGFVLTYSHDGKLRTWKQFGRFALARLARLYPVYLLAILFEAAVAWRLPAGQELLVFPLIQAWSVAASDKGYLWIMQAWSLSIEAFFYCCFPLLLALFSKAPRNFLLTLTIVTAATIAVFQVPFAHPAMPKESVGIHVVLPLLCLPGFIFGMLLGKLFIQQREIQPRSFNGAVTVSGIAAALVVFGTATNLYILSAAACFVVGWLIYRLASGCGLLSSFLSSRTMLLLGGASYSVYILQFPMRELLRKYISTPGIHGLHLDQLLYPFVLIPLTCVIFRYYEEPLRRAIVSRWRDSSSQLT
jgi:peptidoglycan/LPS O-acetylase OafA/YrhL